MKSSVKKTISVAVASAMIVSMAGCSFLDKSKDEVLEAAEPVAKALASCNLSKIAKASVDDFDDVQDDWEVWLDFTVGDEYSSDEAKALSAIADTISYEIDEESVEASKKSGEGSINVTFSIADYESVLDEEYTDVDDFVDAIGDADPVELDLILDFEKEDDSWLFVNYEDVFDELYAFIDEEYVFVAPFSDSVTGVVWYGGDSYGAYNNTDYIDLELSFDYTTGADYSSIYYEITYNGQLIKSEAGSYMAYLQIYDAGVPLDDSGYYLAPGTYVITFYEADGTEIISGTATVTTEFEEFIPDPRLHWWFTDNYDDSNPIYTDTDVIDGELTWSSGTPNYSAISYTVEYEGQIIYEESGSTDAWVYTYEVTDCPLDPSGQYFAAGEYTITYYLDGEFLASGTCTVNVS